LCPGLSPCSYNRERLALGSRKMKRGDCSGGSSADSADLNRIQHRQGSTCSCISKRDEANNIGQAKVAIVEEAAVGFETKNASVPSVEHTSSLDVELTPGSIGVEKVGFNDCPISMGFHDASNSFNSDIKGQDRDNLSVGQNECFWTRQYDISMAEVQRLRLSILPMGHFRNSPQSLFGVPNRPEHIDDAIVGDKHFPFMKGIV
jgi:hypothetical protein